MSKQAALKKFFDRILVGETKSYNDYGYYVCSGSVKDCYRSYIEGSSKYNKKFKLMNNELTSYTLDSILYYQALAKDSPSGQLFGVGRYAIIPVTLKQLIKELKISTNSKFTPELQDELGYGLLVERKNIRNYLYQNVPDTEENLEEAAMSAAMIWSSLGIPKATVMTYQGKTYYPIKNQSYYPFDKATVPSSTVQAALKDLRKELNSPESGSKSGAGSFILFALLAAGYYTFQQFKK